MTPKSPREFNFLDRERQHSIELLTGIHSSKKNYYPALKEKVEELEANNRLLHAAYDQADRLSADLERAVARTSAVLAATRHINSHLSLEEVMEETLAIVTETMGYPWAAIHVFGAPISDAEPVMEAVCGRGQRPPNRIDLDDLRFEWGFSEARRTGVTVVTHDHAADSAHLSLAFCPLSSSGGVLGVLTVAAVEVLADDLEVCESLAKSLTVAVDNASLYRKVSLQAKRLDRAVFSAGSISQALTRTTQGMGAFLHHLVVTVEGLAGAQFVVVLGVREANPEGCLVNGFSHLWWTGRPVAGDPNPSPIAFDHERLRDLASREDQPLWLDADLVRHLHDSGAAGAMGISTRYPEALLIPMRGPGRGPGAIVAFMWEARTLEPGETEILRILGNQTAVSLENTRLYEERLSLQAQAEELYRVTLSQKKQADLRNKELTKALHRINAIEKERIVQEERARIARELHDTVAQVLYSIGLNLDWCRARAADDLELHGRLSSLRDVAGQCVTEIRQSIFELSPKDVTELGLGHALEKLSREYPKLTRISLTLDMARGLPSLGRRVENEIYRVIQEALFNVFKHAAATRAEISLKLGKGELHVVVRDDGIGIDADRPLRGYMRLATTFGLSNMQRRAEAIGGHLRVEGRPGEGTAVTLVVPLDEKSTESVTSVAGVGRSAQRAF